MIQEAGLGIAMKGSTEVVTKVANEIADTNDNEGVSKILQKHYKNINFWLHAYISLILEQIWVTIK